MMGMMVGTGTDQSAPRVNARQPGKGGAVAQHRAGRQEEPMSQYTHLSDDTSDRLYTPEELASYAAAEAAPDPLTDPLTDPLAGPLTDDHEATVIRSRPVLFEAPAPPATPPSGPP